MLSRKLVLSLSTVSLVLLTLGVFHYTPEGYRSLAKAQFDRPIHAASDALDKLKGVQGNEELNNAELSEVVAEADTQYFRFLEDTGDQLPNFEQFKVAEHNIYRNDTTNGKLQTKLFIAFGRNWFMLQQCIVSYLAAGWPAHDITVWDNSGTMVSNERGQLSVDNPAYLNVTRLRQFGVNYERTPALLTFSQLQNFFMSTAMDRGLDYYFWGHMDVIILADETANPYMSFYEQILLDLDQTVHDLDNWILHFYNFDWLTLVNTKSYDLLGGWDSAIPYYTSDCDFYSRVTMWGDLYQNGFELKSVDIKAIYDSLHPLADLSVFFPTSPDEGLNSPRFQKLVKTASFGQDLKGSGSERNQWQNVQTGGGDDPYYKGSWVQDTQFRLLNDIGREMFELKWKTGGSCPAFDVGRRLSDMYT